MTTTESYACSRYRTTALKQVFIFALSILILALITMGCESKTINGQVVDNFGTPLAGVSVQVENSAFSTTTNPQGHYELNYAPGSFNVVFSFQGYSLERQSLELSEKIRLSLEKVVLARIPSSNDSGYFFVPAVNGYFSITDHLVSNPVRVAILYGKEVLLFVRKENGLNCGIYQVHRDKLKIRSANLLDDKRRKPEDKVESEVRATDSGHVWMIKGRLETGTYCISRDGRRTNFEKALANTGEAFCFDWHPIQPETVLEQVEATVLWGRPGWSKRKENTIEILGCRTPEGEVAYGTKCSDYLRTGQTVKVTKPDFIWQDFRIAFSARAVENDYGCTYECGLAYGEYSGEPEKTLGVSFLDQKEPSNSSIVEQWAKSIGISSTNFDVKYFLEFVGQQNSGKTLIFSAQTNHQPGGSFTQYLDNYVSAIVVCKTGQEAPDCKMVDGKLLKKANRYDDSGRQYPDTFSFINIIDADGDSLLDLILQMSGYEWGSTYFKIIQGAEQGKTFSLCSGGC